MLFRSLFFSAYLFSTSASACVTSYSAKLADIVDADVVIKGQVVGGEVVLDDTGAEISDYLRFELKVNEVLVGDLPGDRRETNLLNVVWSKSAFGGRDNIGDKKEYFVGLLDFSSLTVGELFNYLFLRDINEPGIYTILKKACTGYYVFEANERNTAVLQQVLKSTP